MSNTNLFVKELYEISIPSLKYLFVESLPAMFNFARIDGIAPIPCVPWNVHYLSARVSLSARPSAR